MYISIHMPKTAGTTFRRHLEAIFGEELVFDYGSQYEITDPYEPTIELKLRRHIRRFRVAKKLKTRMMPFDRCVHGHFQAAKYQKCFSNCEYITWLRDPVERVISHYHHWCRNPDKSHTVGRIAGNLSITEFAAIESMRDVQHKYLLGTKLEDYFFVGIQERFTEQLPIFYQMMSMEYNPEILGLSQNFNPKKSVDQRYEISEEDRAMISTCNSMDIALYEKAKKLIKDNGWA